MKKSSLKKYITLLEAAADSAKYASAYWVRQHERRVEELLEADNEIAELRRRLDDNGGLERRLDDNGGPCALRVKLTAETCQETIKRLREDNERLSRLLRFHRRNHTFEKDHNDTQA